MWYRNRVAREELAKMHDELSVHVAAAEILGARGWASMKRERKAEAPWVYFLAGNPDTEHGLTLAEALRYEFL